MSTRTYTAREAREYAYFAAGLGIVLGRTYASGPVPEGEIQARLDDIFAIELLPEPEPDSHVAGALTIIVLFMLMALLTGSPQLFTISLIAAGLLVAFHAGRRRRRRAKR